MGFWEGSTQQKTLTEQLLEIQSYFNNEIDRQVTDTNNVIENNILLINSATTQEQINSATNALNNISQRSNKWGETSSNYEIAQNELDNKKFAYNDYYTALEQLSEYRGSDTYFDEASEWSNIDEVRKLKINKDTGDLLYASNVEFLAEEYAKYKNIVARISAGKNAGFRTKPDGTVGNYTENELLTGLELHLGRLDSGLEAAAGDGVITADEAGLIMRGDIAFFRNRRDTIVGTIEKEVNLYTNDMKTIDRINNNFLAGQIGGDDIFNLNSMGLTDVIDTLGTDPDGNPMVTSDAQALINQYWLDAKANNIDAKKRWKAWTGLDYAGSKDEMPDNVYEQMKEEEEELEETFDAMDAEEKDKTDEELMATYGTTDPAGIKDAIELDLAIKDIDAEAEKADKADLIKTYGTTDLDVIKEVNFTDYHRNDILGKHDFISLENLKTLDLDNYYGGLKKPTNKALATQKKYQERLEIKEAIDSVAQDVYDKGVDAIKLEYQKAVDEFASKGIKMSSRGHWVNNKGEIVKAFPKNIDINKIFNELDELLKEKEIIENFKGSGKKMPRYLRDKNINKLIAMEYKKIMTHLNNNSRSEFIEYSGGKPYKINKSK